MINSMKAYIKKAISRSNNFIKEYGVFLNFGLSLIAVGISGYVFFHGGIARNTVDTLGNPIKSSSKLLSELPKNLMYLGNEKSEVVVVEFADFQCPFCHQYFAEVFPKIKSQYSDTGKIKFIFADMAFLGQESVDAAEAARCAGDQGKFWEYHDKLYLNQRGENAGAFSSSNLLKFATDLELDQGAFTACVSSDKYIKDIEALRDLNRSYGITGTPTTFIDGKLIKGAVPFETISKLIDEALKN